MSTYTQRRRVENARTASYLEQKREDENPHVQRCRDIKVARLVLAFDTSLARSGRTPGDAKSARKLVESLWLADEKWWKALAGEARCNVPSRRSREQFIRTYEERRDALKAGQP